MTREPKQQGAFDSACGFYAVANAIGLVKPSAFKPDDFGVLLLALAPRTGLPKQFFAGTGRNELNRMLTALLEDERFVGVDLVRPYWNGGAVTLADYWSKLQHHIGDGDTGRAAIVKFRHEPRKDTSYHHWTVVRKVTDDNLILHDSSDNARIARKRSRIWDNLTFHAARPYALDYTATFLLGS